MLLYERIEHLGPLEEWPTVVLQNPFFDRPKPTRDARPRKVMLFFFGNSVHLKMAYTFYIACCGCTGATARFVVDQTREWYCEWMFLHNKRQIGKYYNMAFKKCYWCSINPSAWSDVRCPHGGKHLMSWSAGSCPPRAGSHSFGNISTTKRAIVIGLL